VAVKNATRACYTLLVAVTPLHVFLPPRVQVCNLNLEVYVFLGVVTVQLGIVCSNYKVQVANLNAPGGR